MPNFFKSFFSGKSETPESQKHRKVKNRKTIRKISRFSNTTVYVRNAWDVRIMQ